MREPTQVGITSVRAAAVEGEPGGAVRLTWSCDSLADGGAMQVYINGGLYDVSCDVMGGEMWVHVDRGREARLELLVVDAAEAFRDYADRLAGWTPGVASAAALRLVRDEAMEVGSEAAVSVDGIAGAARAVWGDRDGRSGFGGLMGVGAFGFDDAAAPGQGMGEFGGGAMGFDGVMLRWRRDDLPVGQHTLAMRVTDGRGRLIGEAAGETVEIAELPRPAARLWHEGATLRWE